MGARWPSGPATVRVNWTLRQRAKALAEQAGEEGAGQSAYVSELLEQRHASWTEALEYLLEQGWLAREIREALVAMPQPPAFPKRPARTVSGYLGQRIGDTVARALLVLAREWAAGNGELARRL